MRSTTPVSTVRETQLVEVAVTSAWGGSGEAFANTTASNFVTLRNVGPFPVEYRIDSGEWIRLELRNSIQLAVSLATTTIRLRKSEFGGVGGARFEIESITGEFTADGHPVELGGATQEIIIARVGTLVFTHGLLTGFTPG